MNANKGAVLILKQHYHDIIKKVDEGYRDDVAHLCPTLFLVKETKTLSTSDVPWQHIATTTKKCFVLKEDALAYKQQLENQSLGITERYEVVEKSTKDVDMSFLKEIN